MHNHSPNIEELDYIEHDSPPAHDLAVILDYLRRRFPSYPFKQAIDTPFIEELLDDFPELDLLEQIKLFRWYYNDTPPITRQPRVAIRRWVGKARQFAK